MEWSFVLAPVRTAEGSGMDAIPEAALGRAGVDLQHRIDLPPTRLTITRERGTQDDNVFAVTAQAIPGGVEERGIEIPQRAASRIGRAGSSFVPLGNTPPQRSRVSRVKS